jgi:mRNA interferase RelE/StbE
VTSVNSRHDVSLAASAERDLDRLPDDLVKPVQRFLDGPLRNNPRKAGQPLEGPRIGMHEALGPGWRVLYQIDDEKLTVRVVVIARRLDTATR